MGAVFACRFAPGGSVFRVDVRPPTGVPLEDALNSLFASALMRGGCPVLLGLSHGLSYFCGPQVTSMRAAACAACRIEAQQGVPLTAIFAPFGGRCKQEAGVELLDIKGGVVEVLYAPAEIEMTAGATPRLLELPHRRDGFVGPRVENGPASCPGMVEQSLQQVLEAQMGAVETLVDMEGGLDVVRSLKVASCRIRARVREGDWKGWDGWLPSAFHRDRGQGPREELLL